MVYIGPTPQDLTRRHLHLRDDRPAAFGRLDFSQPADQVAHLVRALDHGPYWNPLTTAKIVTAAGVVNAGSAQVVTGHAAPGVVLARDEGGLVVACGSGAVRLSRLTGPLGLPVAARDIADTALAPLAADEVRHLGDTLAAIAPHDARHRHAL